MAASYQWPSDPSADWQLTVRLITGPGRQPWGAELLMAIKTKSVTRPRMSGTAMMARHVAVSRPARQGSVSARSASVRGVPSSRVSLVKIACPHGVRVPQAPSTGACVPQAPDSHVVRPRPLPVPVPTCRGLDHQTAC